MSEEEILNYLEKVSKEKTIMPLDNYIQGLLDLYNNTKKNELILANKFQKVNIELNKEKEKNKKIEDKIKGMYDKSNKLIEVTNLYLNTSSKLERLENKIKEIIDKIDVEDYYCLNEAEQDLRKLVDYWN